MAVYTLRKDSLELVAKALVYLAQEKVSSTDPADKRSPDSPVVLAFYKDLHKTQTHSTSPSAPDFDKPFLADFVHSVLQLAFHANLEEYRRTKIGGPLDRVCWPDRLKRAKNIDDVEDWICDLGLADWFQNIDVARLGSRDKDDKDYPIQYGRRATEFKTPPRKRSAATAFATPSSPTASRRSPPSARTFSSPTPRRRLPTSPSPTTPPTTPSPTRRVGGSQLGPLVSSNTATSGLWRNPKRGGPGGLKVLEQILKGKGHKPQLSPLSTPNPPDKQTPSSSSKANNATLKDVMAERAILFPAIAKGRATEAQRELFSRLQTDLKELLLAGSPLRRGATVPMARSQRTLECYQAEEEQGAEASAATAARDAEEDESG